MRLIDADELIENYLNHCRTEFEIKNCCMVNENVIAIIDNAPTIETSYDLYREETCERKVHCYDYKFWHCIGCHGCKADMRKEAENEC